MAKENQRILNLRNVIVIFVEMGIVQLQIVQPKYKKKNKMTAPNPWYGWGCETEIKLLPSTKSLKMKENKMEYILIQ